jgi:hypothetical protein
MPRNGPILVLLLVCPIAAAGDEWRSLPLIKDGKVHPDWLQVGWGGFAVDNGALRTECDERGLGLLVHRREKFGNCQIRVVFKSKDAKSNSGVYVRIDDCIIAAADKNHAPARRDKKGNLTKESLQIFMDASEKDQGAWYAVHHGYEVQICDESEPYHRTGAIYSLAKAAAAPVKRAGEWRTMIITLQGDKILVEIDGKRVTEFDPASKDIPRERKWFEPKREPKRPLVGYIGLQNHDPGDVVLFKEIAVRAAAK